MRKWPGVADSRTAGGARMLDIRRRRRALTTAVTLIVAPVLVGAIWFYGVAGTQAPGVYVEVGDRTERTTRSFALFGYPLNPSASHQDITMHTAALPVGVVRSFFVVSADPVAASVSERATELQVFVVNDADDGFHADAITVPATISRVNSRVYRVTPNAIEPTATTLDYYRAVLTRAAGARATMELLVALTIRDAAGQRTMNSVRLEPPA